MNRLNMALLMLLGTTIWYGCGSDDENTDEVGNVTLAVDGATPMMELAPEDVSGICEDYYGALATIEEMTEQQLADETCMDTAFTAGAVVWATEGSDGEMVHACESALADCEKNMKNAAVADDAEEEVSLVEFCADAGDVVAYCEVPVGQVVNCFNMIINRKVAAIYNDDASLQDCSVLSAVFFNTWQAPVETSEEAFVNPPACDPVFSQCPRLAR